MKKEKLPYKTYTDPKLEEENKEICECGHPKEEHMRFNGYTGNFWGKVPCYCGCKKFKLKK